MVYGWPLIGRQNLATRIIDHLKNSDTFDGDTNTYRTPIYVEHLTEGIVRLVADYHPGISHLAGEDWMNMYQFATAVADVFDLDSTLVTSVQALADAPSKTDSLEGLEQDLRSDLLGLDCTQTSQRLGLRAFGVITGLDEMLATNRSTNSTYF